MGAGASTTNFGTSQVIEAVSNYHDQIKEAASTNEDQSTALFLAISACENLSLVEEKLHELLAYGEHEKVVETVQKSVYIGQTVGLESNEHIDSLNIAAGVLLCTGNPDDLVSAEEYISTGFHYANGKISMSYGRVLLNYYSLRLAQNNAGDASWAKKTFQELLVSNHSLSEDQKFSPKALRYKLQNLALIHRENSYQVGVDVFEKQEIDLIGVEMDEEEQLQLPLGTNPARKKSSSSSSSSTSSSSSSFANETKLSVCASAPILNTPASAQSNQTFSFTPKSSGNGNSIVYDPSPMSVYDQVFFPEDEFKEGKQPQDDSGDLSEMQELLFNLVVDASFENPEMVKNAIEESLQNCRETDAIDTLTQCNSQGDTLLLSACRMKNAALAESILQFGKNIRKNLDLTPQLLGAKNAVGLSPLHVACHANFYSYPVAQALLNYGGAAICFACDRSGCTPLHYAASTGSSELIALLLLHGASALQRDRQGFIPVDYSDPTNIECFNLLYTPLEQRGDTDSTEESTATEAKQNDDANWERRVDAGSNQVYFYNCVTGEVSFIENSNSQGQQEQMGPKDDQQLLSLFTNLAWRVGLERLNKKRKAQAQRFAVAQAKAKLCLLEKGEEKQLSLKRLVSFKNKSLEHVKSQLSLLAEGKQVTQDKLDEMLDQLAKERALRLEQQEYYQNSTPSYQFTEEMVDGMCQDLTKEQKQREQLTSELANVQSEIIKLQKLAQDGKELTPEQQISLDELNEDSKKIESVLDECSSKIANLTHQLALAMDSGDQLSQETIDRLKDLLEKEENLRKQALARAAILEEENRKIYQANQKLATEKAQMEEKLAQERQQLEEEAKMRLLQKEKLESAEKEMGSLQEALEREQQERERAKLELQRIQEEMQKLSKERQNDAKFLAKQEMEVKERIQASESEYSNLKNELEKAQKAKEAAAGELSLLQAKLEKEKKYREKAKSALEGMSQKLNSANQELSMLMKHLENEQKQRERAASELSAVQAEMTRLQEAHVSDLGQSTEQARRAAERARELAEREEKLGLELQGFEADISRLNRELMMANYKSAEAEEELNSMKKRLEEEREKRLDTNSQLSTAKAKLKAIEDERRLEAVKWNMERSQNKREQAALKEEYESLKSQLDAEQKATEKRERDLDQLKRLADENERKLQHERERLAEMSRAKAEAKDEAAREVEMLRAQLEEEKRQREAKDAELRALREKDAERLEEEKAHLLKRLEQEQNWRQQAVSELAESNQKLAEEKRLRKLQLDEEMEKLQAKLRLEAEEKARHQAELDRVKSDMTKLKHMHDQEAGNSAEEAARAAELARKEQELQEKMREMQESMAKLEREKGELYDEFVEEQALRKQYFNEIEDLKGRIRVFCRVRPMSKSEIERGCKPIVKVLDEMHILLSHPEEEGKRKKEDVEFAFDVCFGPEKTQRDIFGDTRRLVQVAIDGYNVCVFAYGQTGSGKTYTLMGPDNQNSGVEIQDVEGDEPPEFAGVATRSIHTLFRLMDRDKARFDFDVSMYIIELYKEDMIDLLYEGPEDKAPPSLSVHLDPQGTVYVENITTKKISNTTETLEALRVAFSKRKITATKMNSHSSRSHLVCSILIKATAKASGVVTNGKLTLVDLAGSERLSKTGATGDTIKEAQAINKSLFILGDVIHALTTNAKHVPYRNHPLTQLMADSIGGNAKTLMFVNVSPADYNLGETKESLRWATRVKQVTNQAGKNTETAQVRALKQQLEKLKKAQAKAGIGPSKNADLKMTALKKQDTKKAIDAGKKARQSMSTLKRPPPKKSS